MKIQLKRSNVLSSGAAKTPTASQLEYGELAVNYNNTDPAIFLKDSNNNVIRISGVGNISDDGLTNVPDGTTPPSNPEAGNLWYNSDQGRLYIYFEDADTSQWVDASPDSWDPSSYPDVTNTSAQSGTLDDRYAMVNGGNGLKIDGSGNVGIGTLSPQHRLSVERDVGIYRASSDPTLSLSVGGTIASPTKTYNLLIDDSDSDKLQLRDGSTARVTMDGSGNVGIGTTTPGSLLELSSAATSAVGGLTLANTNAAGFSTIQFKNTGSSGRTYTLALGGNTSPFPGSVYLYDDTAGAARLVVDSSGKLDVNNELHVHRASTTASNALLALHSDIGGTKTRKCTVRADGSAEFAGRVIAGSTNFGGSAVVNYGILAYNNSASQYPTISAKNIGNGPVFEGRNSANDLNIQLNANGSASFANKVGIGTSSPADLLEIKGSFPIFSIVDSDTTNDKFSILHNGGGTIFQVDKNNVGPNSSFLITQIDGTERMRIGSNGLTDLYSSTTAFRIRTGLTGTSGQLLGGFDGATNTSNGTQRLAIFANGNIQNTNNSYGSLSDIKLKENIVDANSQWDDLKAIQVRNYNFIEGETHTQIGVVAQEVETVSPGLVYETPDRETVQIPVLDENGEAVLDENGQAVVTSEDRDIGTVTKSVNYSVLYMKAVKALQEAMERIETLETKVAALEAG